MTYFFMGLMAAGIVAADQITKYLVLTGFELGQVKPGIDGLFQLTYYKNDGAAWSSFRGMQGLFLVIFLVLTVLVIWEFYKKKMGFTKFEHWCIVAIWAGGLGNMIDRVRLKYVVDMVQLEFINFPVFNVADCFITCGCIALIAHLIFFNKAFWKDKK